MSATAPQAAPARPEDQPPESKIWEGHPSQITNLGYYIGLGIFFWLVFPIAMIAWRWAVTKNTVYRLTTERLTTRTGIFSKHTDELELYRVRDYELLQPFFLHLFSLSIVSLVTSDLTNSRIMLRGVKGGETLLADIRRHVEICRVAKGVREFDTV